MVNLATANGKPMTNQTACLSCPYTIQGHTFTTDFRLLEVQGYDIILMADWIYKHSPVGFNLQTRQFSITKDSNKLITFLDESIPDNILLIGTRKLCQLLKKKAVGAVMVLSSGESMSHANLRYLKWFSLF
jgi:hypothetical protein